MIRIRSGYSFREAAGKLDDVISRLKEIGATEAPITDRASTFGFQRWTKAARKAGLRPIYGVELAVTQSPNEKKPTYDYVTFVAKTEVAPLNRLVDQATSQFRYRPLLTDVQAHETEGVYRILGHRAQIGSLEPVEGTFLALGPSTSMGLAKLAIARGIPLIASSDNRYARAEDRGFYEVLTGRNAETQTYPQHILDEAEWGRSVARLRLPDGTLADAWMTAARVRAGSTAELAKAEFAQPPRPATLRAMAEAGARDLGVDLTNSIYADRLERELSLIEAKRFEDYFYLVADLCQYAREEGVFVGPARGSSCGSLVCYLLKITTVDPIPFGLIFERFIDINRSDLPDIDIDFSDQQREKVFDYLRRTYGRTHVARIGTVAMFKPKSALNECGGALRIPRYKTEPTAESLIVRPDGDARALNTLEDTLRTMPAGQELARAHPEIMVATRFEGHPRHYSQHAAGVVISKQPILDIVAIDRRSGATMCDKKDAEDGYGLLKIDVLGLTQLSVFEDALELAGLPRDALETVPLDDPAAFQILNDRKWSGIFQFNGGALQGITKQFVASKFEDIANVTALARPGPMQSGGAQDWVRRRNGGRVEYPHPMFEPFLAETLGVLVYQEQVMHIGREIGGLSWEDVSALRKLMSKTMGREALGKYETPWKAGAIEKGLEPAVADKVWNDLVTFGQYGFNKSHSVAYALISYWCLWLKAHHPFEFAAATLSHEPDPVKQLKILREMHAEGIGYVPVDKELSGLKWTVGRSEGKRVLVGPLSVVKGIGPKTISDIVDRRERREKLTDRQRKLLENPRTQIDSLRPIEDAFELILPDPAVRNINTPRTPIKDITLDHKDQSVVVFCVIEKMNPSDENAPDKVERREGRVYDGPTTALNLTLADDDDSIFAKISRFDYETLGGPIIARGKGPRSLYAVKGVVWGAEDFRMISVKMVKYIGNIDEAFDLKPVEVKPVEDDDADAEAA